MFRFLSLLILSLFIFDARADYFLTTYKNEQIDFQKPTRILVAGYGDELKLLFQNVSKGKAQKLKEQYPNDQIVLIAVEEEDLNNEAVLTKWGFNIVKRKKGSIDAKSFLNELNAFDKILSLDIFSHSSAQFGIHLKSRLNHLTTSTKGLEKLKGNFVKGAYVVLHGCNTGFYLAPHLSRVWGVPVAGSLTSTNFQRLHSNGNFYLEEDGMQPSKDWSEKNELSFDQPLNCKDSYCQRVKADISGYVGHWGEYDGGLPFLKWFCANNTKEECSSVMAKNLLTQISIVNLKKDSSLAVYKKAVFDFICPISSKRDLRRECQEQLELALVKKDYTYNPFLRDQLECDFNKCKADIKCDTIIFTKIPKPGTCRLINHADTATTTVREFKSYLEAYQYLK